MSMGREHDLDTLRLAMGVLNICRVLQTKLNRFDDWSHRSTFSAVEHQARHHVSLALGLIEGMSCFSVWDKEPRYESDEIHDGLAYCLEMINELEKK